MKSKTTRLLIAAVLASIALGGILWALAWWQPSTAKAEISASLPTPYLSHPDVVDAPYNYPPPPTVDGAIAPGEYAGAGKVTFEGYGGYYNEVEVFFTQDGSNLYVAFELPDRINHIPVPAVSVFLDTNNDGGSTPQTDDFRFQIWRNTGWGAWQGNGSVWNSSLTLVWTHGLTETMSGWSAEFAIPFTTTGISGGAHQELGLALGNSGIAPQDHYWPKGSSLTQPSTWGSLVSSSDWDNAFYWKPGPWEDYAPSGLPDFDQKQPPWGISGPTGVISTHCGPVAMANSLWWFDSKFETLSGTSPISTISDSYRLVTSYNPGVWDDHDPQNVGGLGPAGLVDDLARYFGTNQGLVGTNVISMFYGTHRYLRDHGLWDDYIVTLVEQPDFRWVADEVMRSEDVILLLGFYQEGPTGGWERLGGHYVSVAGVDPAGPIPMIAFSDPYVDAAELGLGPGRVLDGVLIIPHNPGHAPFVHNDAGNVSHDMYPVISTYSPGGNWGPDPSMYPSDLFEPWFGLGVNPHPKIQDGFYDPFGPPIWIEVEFALTVSPYTWKSSGYWEPNPADSVRGTWQPWVDYAVNGVPDFNQRQDNWINPSSVTWSYCGPVAAANSLWWFDSKFEPNPLGPPPPPPPPPPAPVLPPPPPPPLPPVLPPNIIPFNDTYPMVSSYWGPPYDDHDPSNVESGFPAPPLPPPWWLLGPTAPGGEFVDELAAYFDTDDQMPPSAPHAGTNIADMVLGIERYIIDRQVPQLPPGITLRQGYVITMTHSPDFWWVAEEIEHSEDVILLLGFWQNQSGDWVRLGGHYVTAAGVDKQGGFVGFSDPWYDGAEFNWPYAYPSVIPTVMGRVADGRMYLHSPYQIHAAHVHNDAGNISHDVYRALPTGSPGGVWGPWGYLETWEGNFEGQNGGQTGTWNGNPTTLQAEVDGAVAVSPVADVWASKGASPNTLIPGETVTFTIQFGNYGSLPAEDVVLTDTLPTGLTNPAFVGYWTSNGLTVTHRTGTTFTWDLPDLAWLDWGIITITAQADPSLAWPVQTTLTNTVNIATSSIEQYQIAELTNVATAPIIVQTADVQISKSAQPPVLKAGEWLTYTLVYTNAGAATATNTVVTDQLHGWLENSSYSLWKSYGGLVAIGDKYTFHVGNVPAGGRGIITITAQVSPTLSGGGTLPNAASIGTDTPESSDTNNSASASSTVVYYAVDLQPGTGGIAENPGTVVTYTLTVYNTGNVTDTYTIAGVVSGQSWPTQWPSSVGPVAGGGNASFDVTVAISSSASSGQWSRVDITATSQGDSGESVTSALTTTAQVGAITRGVEVAPSEATGNGDPDSTVTYTLRITNTGTAADVIGLSYTGPSTWTVSFSASPVSLAADAGIDVAVYVAIPASAPAGSTGVITVTATSQADPTKTDAAILTTTVSWKPVYLPLAMRNY